jgi:L-seryl-tRNA(Ser) seleniumtransferase
VGAGEHAGPVDALRALPAVHELAAALDGPHALAVAAARQAIDERRAAVRADDGRRTAVRAGEGGGPDAALAGEQPEALVARARELLAESQRGSLRRVLNATGVIVHTNLGRAPLVAAAQDAVARAAEGYSNLELALDTGARGSRQAHVAALLCELTGAEAALAVNNGAGAVLLAASALAGPGRAIVVSRGQLVEIGGGFRIPEVIAQSGSAMLEVGTTNRTRLADYERALQHSELPVGAVLRVHPSNFRTVGFVEEVTVEALCGLGVPMIDDAGSGVLGAPAGATALGLTALGEEPAVARSVAAGAALVCCSGDKLLGGPQAGLLAGRADAIAAAAAHPLARALRIDKLSLAALEATLRLYRDPERARREIPVLAMLDADRATLQRRAEALLRGIGSGEIVEASARVGGGALPLLELSGPVVALDGAPASPVALASALRAGDPPVVGRIHDGRLLLDPRTLTDDEVAPTGAAVRAARELLGAP